MKPCAHKSRAEATACPFFRAHKADRIAPLHGPNEFTWQLTVPQQAIMGSIAQHDPRPVDTCDVYVPIRSFFQHDCTAYALTLFEMQALGLVWIDYDSNLCGWTAEGREHVEKELAAVGTTLAMWRLAAQAEAPSTFHYPASFIDRIQSCLSAHDERRILNAPLISEAVQ
ncbi:MAG TPA: hypothetical protein VGQ12_07400 [Candidatus Angelobacter sp.]|jgi:hypothetical protein|nr:hypothetical protein [Candidatus Angelobacter sp.]